MLYLDAPAPCCSPPLLAVQYLSLLLSAWIIGNNKLVSLDTKQNDALHPIHPFSFLALYTTITKHSCDFISIFTHGAVSVYSLPPSASSCSLSHNLPTHSPPIFNFYTIAFPTPNHHYTSRAFLFTCFPIVSSFIPSIHVVTLCSHFFI